MAEAENRPAAVAEVVVNEHSRRAEVVKAAAEKEAGGRGMEEVERVVAETEMVEVGKAAAGIEMVVAGKAEVEMETVVEGKAVVD